MSQKCLRTCKKCTEPVPVPVLCRKWKAVQEVPCLHLTFANCLSKWPSVSCGSTRKALKGHFKLHQCINWKNVTTLRVYHIAGGFETWLQLMEKTFWTPPFVAMKSGSTAVCGRRLIHMQFRRHQRRCINRGHCSCYRTHGSCIHGASAWCVPWPTNSRGHLATEITWPYSWFLFVGGSEKRCLTRQSS
jgi:hypothetical protein